MKSSFLFCLCVFFFAFHVSAKVYKVANSDECKKAAEAAVAGDEIIIANGNYSGWEIIFSTIATVNKPIQIRAEKAGQVVFSGTVKKPIFQLTGNYIEISGLTFSDCEVIKAEGISGILIEIKSGNHCRITRCTFSGNTVKTQFMPIVTVSGRGEYNRIDNCIFTGNIDNQELQVKITATDLPVYTTIDHNIFKDKKKVSWKLFNGGECVQIGQDPILLGTKYSYTTVSENRFINCNGEPEVISNKSSGNKYIRNYFENCVGELVMRGGHDCLIDSNTFKGGTGGIRLNGTHHTVTNNMLSDLPTGIRLMYGMGKGKNEIGFYIAASDCVIKNNSITNTATGIFIGDSKNVDWTGKFDTTRYPSRTMQDIAPFDNIVTGNKITGAKNAITNNVN